MKDNNKFLIVSTLFILQPYLCSSKERYNTNVDFLLHEAGGNTGAIKNYDSQFPSLNPRPKPFNQQGVNTYTTVTQQFPTLKPPSTPAKPGAIPNSNFNGQIGTTTRTTPAPKRDYVAPQFTTTKPRQESNQHAGGKVKDLINFYDSKDKKPAGTIPTARPSYSSVLHDSKVTQGSTISTPKPTQGVPNIITPKPFSYSDILSGSNKHDSKPVSPTQKPVNPNQNNNNPTVTNTGSNNLPSRPNSPKLPSSLASGNSNNNNKNIVTDNELQIISEELLRKDVNNAAKYVTVNYQEKTTSYSKDDKAPQPLLTVAPEAWNIPTVQKFLPLLDNYERDTTVNEHVNAQERNEENTFMDAIMATTVIRHLMTFLKDKGYVSQDPKQQRDFLKHMWFGLYSRGKGIISSSGFEHVFVSELKNGEVSGLHNWIYFSKEESANRINYLGYLKYVQMNDKGVVMKVHFNQQGTDKPVDSMFIGTSPEFEIAVYTLCYVTRPDTECKLKLGSKDVEIIVYKYRYRSKNYIGSAYPNI